MKAVSVNCHIILHSIHERLDIQHLAVKDFLISFPQPAQKGLAQVRKGMAVSWNRDVKAACQEAVYSICRVVSIGQQGHKSSYSRR